MSFDIFVTDVFAFECAFNSLSSDFVHSRHFARRFAFFAIFFSCEEAI